MIGWISLHRSIQSHWIWKDPNKFQWWVDILLTVNSEDEKVSLGNELFICKRGESLRSIQSWADRWHVSKDTARNFLTLLEKDNMILRVSVGKSTRLTVCNYDSYQDALHVKKRMVVRNTDTNNNILSKDNIKKKKEEFGKMLEEFKDQYPRETLKDFYRYWGEPDKGGKKLKWEMEKTWETKMRLVTWKKKGDEMQSRYKNKSQTDYEPIQTDN